MDKEDLIAYIHLLIETGYNGRLPAFAEDKGISRTYLYNVLSGRRDPGKKILDAIGLEKKKIWIYTNKYDRP